MDLWLTVTALLGATFVGGQVYEFTSFYREGLGYTTSLFSSSFYTLTGFHGVHVSVGIIMLMALVGINRREPVHRRPGRGGRARRPVLALRRHRVDPHLHARLPDPVLSGRSTEVTTMSTTSHPEHSTEHSADEAHERPAISDGAQVAARSRRPRRRAPGLVLRQDRDRPRGPHGVRDLAVLRRHRPAVPAVAADPHGDQVLHGRAVLHAPEVRQHVVQLLLLRRAVPRGELLHRRSWRRSSSSSRRDEGPDVLASCGEPVGLAAAPGGVAARGVPRRCVRVPGAGDRPVARSGTASSP